MKRILFKKITKRILVFLFIFFSAHSALAAKLYFTGQQGLIRVGDYFQVVLRVNTEGQSINALGGQVNFSWPTLALQEISDGNSIINLWLDKPKIEKSSSFGVIDFSGLIPGGVTAENGTLLSLLFLAKAVGPTEVKVEGARLYLNGPDALEAEWKATALSFNVLAEDARYPFAPKPNVPDFAPPAPFIIHTSRSPDIFDNHLFISFQTQDKRSGIDYYEVRESWLGFRGQWQRAESPYQLSDQGGFSIIEVKAIDRAGYSVKERFVPQRLYIVGIILLASLVLGSWVLIKRWQSKKLLRNEIERGI